MGAKLATRCEENFPVHYVKLRGHDHNYYALRDHINEQASEFPERQKLPNPQP